MSKTYGPLFWNMKCPWLLIYGMFLECPLLISCWTQAVSATQRWHPVGQHFWHECYGYVWTVWMFHAVQPSRTCQTLPQSGTLQTNLQNGLEPSNTFGNPAKPHSESFKFSSTSRIVQESSRPVGTTEPVKLSKTFQIREHSGTFRIPPDPFKSTRTFREAQTFQIDLKLFNTWEPGFQILPEPSLYLLIPIFYSEQTTWASQRTWANAALQFVE